MKTIILQDVFLNQARKEKIQVTFKDVAGLEGAKGRQNLVYKHAISTIIPAKVISILDQECEENNDD